MKAGIFVFHTDTSLDPAILAKRAEELGFDSFWVPEHTIIPVHTTSPHRGSADGSIPEPYYRITDPFVALARASGATKTIKLGTGICLVPERNPLVLAKEVATLDQLSGGRFIFGIGAGWLREESEILGGDFPRRWSQTREAILAMKELWTKEPAEHHGKYYDFPPVHSRPKPAQKPHPPIYLGSTDKKVLERIAEWGDGWMPIRVTMEDLKRGRGTLDELATAGGRDPRSIKILAFGGSGQYRDRKSLGELEEAGVDQVTVWLEQTEGDAALAEMEQVAGQIL